MMKRVTLLVTFALTICAACLMTGCGASLDREINVQEMSFKVPSSWLESPSDNNSESSGVIRFEDVDSDKDDDETADLIIVNYGKLTEKSNGNDLPEPSADENKKEQSDTEPIKASKDALTETQRSASDAEPENGESEEKSAESEIVESKDEAAQDSDKQKKNSSGEKAEQSKEVVAKTATEAITAKQKKLEKEYEITNWSIDEDDSRVIDGAQVTTYGYSFVKDIDGVKQKYEYKTVYIFTTDTFFEIFVLGDQANINSIVDSIEF